MRAREFRQCAAEPGPDGRRPRPRALREPGTALLARPAPRRFRRYAGMTALAPLALTMGEPAGIGAEIAMAAWLRRGKAVPPFFLLDDVERVAALARRLGWTVPLQTIA